VQEGLVAMSRVDVIRYSRDPAKGPDAPSGRS